MSLESLLEDKRQKEADKLKLENLKTALAPLYRGVNSLFETLKTASEAIGKAGKINGHNFDNGKTEEYATDIENTGVKIDNAIQAVQRDIREVDREIRTLTQQIAAEQRRLQQIQQPQTQNSNTNKAKTGGKRNGVFEYEV